MEGGKAGRMGADIGAEGSMSRDGESQEGGDPGTICTVVPGRRDEGRASRCSMKVTWKELKSFPDELSHKR
jgi:hypothetical protein